MPAVSDNLRTVLFENNMSQTDFAHRVGTSFGYINMLLNGRRVSMSKTLALLIEELYGYRTEWLLKNSGDKMKNWLKLFLRENPQFIEKTEKLTIDEKNLVIKFIDSLEDEEEKRREERIPKYKRK